jgi:hypothetical protein
MSDSRSIAAVTATLRNLLFAGVNADVAGTDVTTRPLDRVRVNGQGNRLNVFLYHTSIDPAWRNQEIPGQVMPGEDGRPPLPLTLYYLLTAYAQDDDEIVGHRMLGRAISVLHDHPVLGAQEIKAALAESDLDQQIERIRITPQPLTVEEMSKLWTTFQTQYRISAAYQICVVLIESRLAVRTPPPVVARGDQSDTGPVAQSSTVPPVPTIERVVIPDKHLSALLGDSVLMTGHDLEGTETVEIQHRRLHLPLAVPVPPGAANPESITFTVPPAGAAAVGLSTNRAPFAVAPAITRSQATRGARGIVTVRLDCAPAVVKGQEVLLLLSERAIPLEPVAGATAALAFEVRDLPAGRYPMRLRVDGIDSHLVDRSVSPPVFDPAQILEVP